MRRLILLGLVLASGPASAERHVVERGETLEHVARVHGCSVASVLRANRLNTTLVPAGTIVTIPTCGRRARRSSVATTRHDDADDRARRALEVIDGATFVAAARVVEPAGPATSVGQPWNGRLKGGEALPHGEGYRIRRPHKAFGAGHVVGHLKRVIAEVRALHPGVHTLAIGDLSAKHGGQLDRHHSHQSGLDVDLGFYFTRQPREYPAQFVAANADLDLEATWALIAAFARTTRVATGVQVIFLDHAVQARLYRFARKRGTPDDQLAEILQYPRDPDALVGLVRHWPSHSDHLHVRFKSSR